MSIQKNEKYTNGWTHFCELIPNAFKGDIVLIWFLMLSEGLFINSQGP